MPKFKELRDKEKLNAVIFSIFAINCIIYLCLLFYVDAVITYDLFNKTVPLTDYRILLLPVAYCIMLLFILFSYNVLDTEAEPVFSIFKSVGKLDFYVRLSAVIITFILLKGIININNKIYLYVFLIFAFVLNLYLENNIKKIISNTSDSEIECIKNANRIFLSEEKVEKYKSVVKNGKISFFIIFCFAIPFKSVLNNTYMTFIFFFIYSALVLYLLKDTYFLLYEKKEATKKLLVNYFIMLCGFILVLLLNEKVIVPKVHNFSQQEIISLISFFTFPFYYPTRIVYLSLKRSNNIS